MNVFDANIVHNRWKLVPVEDVVVKVLYSMEEEYCFEVPKGTTVEDLKEKLLTESLEKFGGTLTRW